MLNDDLTKFCMLIIVVNVVILRCLHARQTLQKQRRYIENNEVMLMMTKKEAEKHIRK